MKHTRMEQMSLIGDHLAWWGYYVPVKSVVDGDLCDTLPPAKHAIAGELDRSVS